MTATMPRQAQSSCLRIGDVASASLIVASWSRRLLASTDAAIGLALASKSG